MTYAKSNRNDSHQVSMSSQKPKSKTANMKMEKLHEILPLHGRPEIDRLPVSAAHHNASGKLRNIYIRWLSIVLLTLCMYFLIWSAEREPRRSTQDGGIWDYRHPSGLPLKPIPSRLRTFQDCSVRNIQATNLTSLETASSLPLSEFVSRRDRLAQALVHDGLDAFVVEPGYTFSFYGRIPQQDWEPWEPEERPFLMVVRPSSSSDGKVVANTSFLVPTFEAERAKLLGMPFNEPLQLVTWEEHWDPYGTLKDSRAFEDVFKEGRMPKVMVDDEIRDFISRGLGEAGFAVVGLGGAPETVRQTKSTAEIDILRAANTGTVESLRAMRSCMHLGLTESDVATVLDNTMRAAGLDPFFDIVLFDEDASNPHGGSGGNKRLTSETMVLIDVGAHLHGYSSDICRSFFPPSFAKPESNLDMRKFSEDLKHKIDVWNIVLDAQSASLLAMHETASAASVDIAARSVIESAGYAKAFTHRVGHGIGIKAHESPYLNKGNNDTILKANMTFTSEPGIYLPDEFGVRHEDVLLVRSQGMPEVLTGSRATDPWTP